MVSFATQRRSKRLDFSNTVVVENGSSKIKASYTDISQGGMFIQTMDPPPVGSHLTLRIRLMDDRTIVARGIVRHNLRWVGMGLEFSDLHPKARSIISDLEKLTPD